ncbi:S1 RNA-binding domain-containing protein [Candidatus Parcubacteria bacterium]|nr:S1 RNA-binding domain-containing protein [Candidatus Parcubacteria bacterium]
MLKSDDKDLTKEQKEFQKLLDKEDFRAPMDGELIKGSVISASKAEVKIDLKGILTGVVRGPELYEEDEAYANLKAGDEVEATVINSENENGDIELSFRYAGQEKAWDGLRTAFSEGDIITVRIVDANKGGLMVKYRQIPGFLPVSQLAPENYPRVNGGDKGKILEKLRSFIGCDFEVKIMTFDEKNDKIIFSEKKAWNEKQKDIISKYQVGTIVEGEITAITDFGVFISFGENLEGLIHISELAWQRIDNPSELYKTGENIKAEVISLDNSKIFLSAKKLLKDPWGEVAEKYKINDKVEGKILKVNPFGLFVSLDADIHGLAHISQLDLAPKQRIYEKFKAGTTEEFTVVSIEPKDHRLGLAFGEGALKKEDKKEKEEKEDKKDKKENKEKKEEKKEEKEDKKKEK